MGSMLKPFFFSAALVIATAAHATAIPAGGSSGSEDTYPEGTEASAEPSAEHAAYDREDPASLDAAAARVGSRKADRTAEKQRNVIMVAPDPSDPALQYLWQSP
jgi:hypothetical protein